jgi:Zn-dependent protease with chaperone function
MADVLPPAPLSGESIQTARGIRARWERAMLRGTLLLIAVIVVGLASLSGGLWALPLISWLLLGPLLALLQGGQALASAVLVGPDCCAAWHESVQRARAWLVLEARDHSRLLVYQNPQLNAAALWWPGRPLLLLTSGLAERFAGPEDDPLRRAIWGHELAHTLWHQPWNLWLRLPGALPPLLRLPWLPLVVLVNLISLAWSRQAEQSADRLALVASGSLLATADALVTVATGMRLTDAANLRAQFQAQEAISLFGLDRLAQLGSSHPFLWWRLRRLVDYACSTEFAHVVGLELAETVRWEAAALGFHPDQTMALPVEALPIALFAQGRQRLAGAWRQIRRR